MAVGDGRKGVSRRRVQEDRKAECANVGKKNERQRGEKKGNVPRKRNEYGVGASTAKEKQNGCYQSPGRENRRRGEGGKNGWKAGGK